MTLTPFEMLFLGVGLVTPLLVLVSLFRMHIKLRISEENLKNKNQEFEKEYKKKEELQQKLDISNDKAQNYTRMILQLERYNDDLRRVHHKIITRLAALEQYIKNRALTSRAEEFGNELFAGFDEVNALSSEFESEVSAITPKRTLMSTGIRMVDILFDYFSAQAHIAGIEFTLNVHGGITEMVQEVVSSRNLEILVSNHVKNALTSLEMSKEENKRLLVNIGWSGGHYLLSVWDSGISFEVDTLIKLGGKERVSPRLDIGGGIGFMDTFGILDESKASLTIRERKPGGNFTKSIIIRFDGLHKYIIETYRADEFPKSEMYDVVSI